MAVTTAKLDVRLVIADDGVTWRVGGGCGILSFNWLAAISLTVGIFGVRSTVGGSGRVDGGTNGVCVVILTMGDLIPVGGGIRIGGRDSVIVAAVGGAFFDDVGEIVDVAPSVTAAAVTVAVDAGVAIFERRRLVTLGPCWAACADGVSSSDRVVSDVAVEDAEQVSDCVLSTTSGADVVIVVEAPESEEVVEERLCDLGAGAASLDGVSDEFDGVAAACTNGDRRGFGCVVAGGRSCSCT